MWINFIVCEVMLIGGVLVDVVVLLILVYYSNDDRYVVCYCMNDGGINKKSIG